MQHANPSKQKSSRISINKGLYNIRGHFYPCVISSFLNEDVDIRSIQSSAELPIQNMIEVTHDEFLIKPLLLLLPITWSEEHKQSKSEECKYA